VINEIMQIGKGPALRDNILNLEAAMKAMPEHQVHIEPKHYFAPGLYLREIFIPKGVTLTGKIHKTEHLCILSQGELSVRLEDGIQTLKASTVVKSLPGMKRILYAHEDSVWINVHHNPENIQDLDKIEEEFVTDTFEQYYLQSKRTMDDAIRAIGVDASDLQKISENEKDQVAFNHTGVKIADSPIHGKGVFAEKAFKAGEKIEPALLNGLRTPVGRYGNHGFPANAEAVKLENNDVYFVAVADIKPGDEILTDYYFNFVNSRLLIKGEN
jgi:hypothetical protein